MLQTEKKECRIHGLTEFVFRENTEQRWRCRKCNSESVSKRRRKVKTTLVIESGSKCIDCGFQGPPFMFDFDHRDTKEKSFNISSARSTRGIDILRQEVAKCDLVCANCHRMRTHKQRCSGCEYCVKDFPKKEEKVIPNHGTSNSYNNKRCRCSLCKGYKAKARREYRIRKKEQEAR